MRTLYLTVGVIFWALAGCSAVPVTGSHASGGSQTLTSPVEIKVSTQAEFDSAVERARPGDVIVLANGVWRDADLVLDARGTQKAPIRLKGETPGQVILSGRSSLRMAGSWLEVSDLVFRDGYTPRGNVISFRRDEDNLATNSRLTRVVVEDYSNPDRSQVDLWVALYGRNNRVDHNHFSGKLNAGPTMAVILAGEASQQNAHEISYNYFGPRPVFGSNGGETLRIGTSAYSLTRSGTRVENNYFDRCNGEVEIISNKSGGNIYRNNTFFESRGTLTLRHGSDTLVENNLFDGNDAQFTGGIRIINPRQTVRNNYFRRLTGTRFSGALVIMNGIYNSPINRYHQVDGAIIENNSFDHVARIELGEGADAERTAPPVNSAFRANLIVGASEEPVFRIQSDMTGIAFSENVSAAPVPAEIASGFSVVPLAAGSDFLAPRDGKGAAGPFGVARDATGVAWYPKADALSPFEGGREIPVAPGPGTLAEAVAGAAAGDILVLAPGDYTEPTLIDLTIPITVKAADDKQSPILFFERPNLFVLSGRGSLRLSGLTVSGAKAPDATGNSFITTGTRIASRNHIVEMTDMEFDDLTVNRSFSVIKASKGTFFDRIQIERSVFQNISGSVLKLDSETDDFGIYNAEFIAVSGTRFENISEPAISLYRGGTDESTFGPNVVVKDSAFKSVGSGKAPILNLHGVQNLELSGNSSDSGTAAALVITTGTPVVVTADNKAPQAPGGSFLATTDLRTRK